MTESIVLTGGPCGGKSSALPFLKEELEKCGWRVLTVGETATDLMQSGITPSGKSMLGTNLNLQVHVLHCEYFVLLYM